MAEARVKMQKSMLLCLALSALALLAPAANAGPYETAVRAYEAGHYAQALKLFSRLANAGYPEAQNALGTLFEDGHAVARNFQLAGLWYRKAAVQGDVQAQFNLAYLYDARLGEYRKAVKWYRKAAAANFPNAQCNLGVMYQKGLGVKRDYRQAYKWYKAAASHGVPQAQSDLGFLYEHGLGVPQDYSNARKYYEKAVAQGDAMATYNLGLLYFYGTGVSPDYVRARTLFTQAAKSKIPRAQYMLGLVYERGLGVQKNPVLALHWYKLASAGGSRKAAGAVKRLAEESRDSGTSDRPF